MIDADTVFDSCAADAVFILGASAVSPDTGIDIAVKVVQYSCLQIDIAALSELFAQQEAAAQDDAVHGIVGYAHSIVAGGYAIIVAAQMYVAGTYHRFDEPVVFQCFAVAVFNCEAHSVAAKITFQFLSDRAAVSAGLAVYFTYFSNDVHMVTFVAGPGAVQSACRCFDLAVAAAQGSIAFSVLPGQTDAPVTADLVVVTCCEAVVFKFVIAADTVDFDLAADVFSPDAVVVVTGVANVAQTFHQGLVSAEQSHCRAGCHFVGVLRCFLSSGLCCGLCSDLGQVQVIRNDFCFAFIFIRPDPVVVLHLFDFISASVISILYQNHISQQMAFA